MHGTKPPRLTHQHVIARLILWDWLSWRHEVMGLESSPREEGSLSHSQKLGSSSQWPGSELAITSCCETVILHYLFTTGICLGKGYRIQCAIFVLALHAFLLLLSLAPFSHLSHFPLSYSAGPAMSVSLSFSLHLSILSFLRHETLWFTGCDLGELSPWSLCVSWVQPQNGTSLLLHVISWFYKVHLLTLQWWGLLFSPAEFRVSSLAPWPCSWKPLSGVRMCQDYATKLVSG